MSQMNRKDRQPRKLRAAWVGTGPACTACSWRRRAWMSLWNMCPLCKTRKTRRSLRHICFGRFLCRMTHMQFGLVDPGTIQESKQYTRPTRSARWGPGTCQWGIGCTALTRRTSRNLWHTADTRGQRWILAMPSIFPPRTGCKQWLRTPCCRSHSCTIDTLCFP